VVLVTEIQEDDQKWVMTFFTEQALADYLEMHPEFKLVRQAWIPETELALEEVR
jgi:hypothetical protein